MECFVCIHCHFYQPPRENPWLEAVESQDSANPYHDWNERIARECYLPNGAARILDPDRRIARIVNNYARISFNFGPTLLSWMEQQTPEGYQRILDGDRESRRLFSGHGSALAQSYNHTILPLSNSRDKRTQILWGIEDFERRFRRDPEGMWLPETAVDIETLEILSAEGIKFTILAPSQAAQVRAARKLPWSDLEYGIDSRRAYTCNLPSGRSIGLFFYDGATSTAVAFERLLASGEIFARRLLARFDPEGPTSQLMHIATDGESYGHHHAHGDMALAYALAHIEQQKLARITNYGEYFALYPPEQEVRIHEKTAWSCVHGVGRWESNCGCNSGGHSGWNQEWRQPLREALDWLRDDLALAYQRDAKKILRDPWAARDEYVEVLLDRSGADKFLQKHSAHRLSFQEKIRALRLLEMQRHLMLMYTSCGWFFDEVTGPETVQVLQYAGRAVQLGQQLFGGDREEQFLTRLEQVCSNIPEFGNGREIYERFVRPAMLDLPGVAAHYAISSFFKGFHASDSICCYQAELHDVNTFEGGKLKCAAGSASITADTTHAVLDFNFAVLHAGGHILCAGIAPRHAGDSFARLIDTLRDCVNANHFQRGAALMQKYFGNEIYSLKSLFRDERNRVVKWIMDSALANIDQLYSQVYDENVALIGFLRDIQLPLPPILRVSAEFVLGNAIQRYLNAEDADLDRVRAVLETATRHGIDVDAAVTAACRQRLDLLMQRWGRDPLDLPTLIQLEPLVSFMRVPPFESDLWRPQNVYYELLKTLESLGPENLSPTWLEHFRSLGDRLGFAVLSISDSVPVPAKSPETQLASPPADVSSAADDSEAISVLNS